MRKTNESIKGLALDSLATRRANALATTLEEKYGSSQAGAIIDRLADLARKARYPSAYVTWMTGMSLGAWVPDDDLPKEPPIPALEMGKKVGKPVPRGTTRWEQYQRFLRSSRLG